MAAVARAAQAGVGGRPQQRPHVLARRRQRPHSAARLGRRRERRRVLAAQPVRVVERTGARAAARARGSASSGDGDPAFSTGYEPRIGMRPSDA